MKSLYSYYFCLYGIMIKEMFLLQIPSKRESRLLSQRLATYHRRSKLRARYFGPGLVCNSEIKIKKVARLSLLGIIRQHFV